MGCIVLKVRNKSFQSSHLLIASIPDPIMKPVKVLECIFSDLFPELEAIMIGTSHAPEEPGYLDILTKINSGSVVEELKTFVKECK